MNTNRILSIGFELSKTIIFALIGLFLIHFFIATIFVVDGESMEPNFHTGQFVLVNKLAYLTGDPQRGDVVVLRFPGDPKKSRYIKRVIGLPGETINIANGQVYVNRKKLPESYIPQDVVTEAQRYRHIELGQEEYFVVGDNRPNSSDSRIWGYAKKQDLIGRTRFVLLPFSQAGYVSDAFYD